MIQFAFAKRPITNEDVKLARLAAGLDERVTARLCDDPARAIQHARADQQEDEPMEGAGPEGGGADAGVDQLRLPGTSKGTETR